MWRLCSACDGLASRRANRRDARLQRDEEYTNKEFKTPRLYVLSEIPYFVIRPDKLFPLSDTMLSEIRKLLSGRIRFLYFRITFLKESAVAEGNQW